MWLGAKAQSSGLSMKAREDVVKLMMTRIRLKRIRTWGVMTVESVRGEVLRVVMEVSVEVLRLLDEMPCGARYRKDAVRRSESDMLCPEQKTIPSPHFGQEKDATMRADTESNVVCFQNHSKLLNSPQLWKVSNTDYGPRAQTGWHSYHVAPMYSTKPSSVAKTRLITEALQSERGLQTARNFGRQPEPA